MVDVKPSNNKLVDRARRIFKTLLPESLLMDLEIDSLIASCDGSVKLALVVEKLACSINDARMKLQTAGGVLKKAWDGVPDTSLSLLSPPLFVLSIDAGGTKCAAVVANKDGIQSRAEAGPCNLYAPNLTSNLRVLALNVFAFIV